MVEVHRATELMVSVVLLACTPTRAQLRPDPVEAQMLAALMDIEPAFRAFVETPLACLQAACSLDHAEAEIERLADIRDRYLAVLMTFPRNGYSALAMLRIAELHLDLAARIRTLPPPPEASEDNAQAFFELTEVYATPLQGAGVMVLRKLISVPYASVVATPWIERAVLYLAIHGGQAFRRDASTVARLQGRVGKRERFAAPHRLLQSHTLTRRAARLLP